MPLDHGHNDIHKSPSGFLAMSRLFVNVQCSVAHLQVVRFAEGLCYHPSYPCEEMNVGRGRKLLLLVPVGQDYPLHLCSVLILLGMLLYTGGVLGVWERKEEHQPKYS